MLEYGSTLTLNLKVAINVVDLPPGALPSTFLLLRMRSFSFAVVCSSWRTAVEFHFFRCRLLLLAHCRRIPLLSLPCSSIPQLMLPFNPTLNPSLSAAAFFNLADRCPYRIPLPDPPISERLIISSFHG